jgi:hypothetical protein
MLSNDSTMALFTLSLVMSHQFTLLGMFDGAGLIEICTDALPAGSYTQ